MKRLNVIEVVGSPVLLNSDKGDQLKEAMQNALHEASHITVDFEGYQFLSTMFLNFSVGRLCLEHDWGRVEFQQHVTILNLADDDWSDVELAFDNVQKRRELSQNNIDITEYYDRNVVA
jgi:hypothetical protein